jgi:hypothetical protein
LRPWCGGTILVAFDFFARFVILLLSECLRVSRDEHSHGREENHCPLSYLRLSFHFRFPLIDLLTRRLSDEAMI